MNQEIGLRIQEVRKKKGLSRGDLADMSGISPKFIFQIEKQGFGFSVDTLMQLTRVLETSYDYPDRRLSLVRAVLPGKKKETVLLASALTWLRKTLCLAEKRGRKRRAKCSSWRPGLH